MKWAWARGAAGKWTTYQRLEELRGISRFFGLTIALETDDAKRFADAENFAGYDAQCRRCYDRRKQQSARVSSRTGVRKPRRACVFHPTAVPTLKSGAKLQAIEPNFAGSLLWLTIAPGGILHAH